MDLLPYERSTALWHRAAYLQRRLEQLVAIAPAGLARPSRGRRGDRVPVGVPGPLRGRPSAGWPPARPWGRRRRSTRSSSPRPSRRSSTSSPTAWRRHRARRRRGRANAGAPSSSTRARPPSTAAAPRSSATSSPADCSTSETTADGGRRARRSSSSGVRRATADASRCARSTRALDELGWRDALTADRADRRLRALRGLGRGDVDLGRARLAAGRRAGRARHGPGAAVVLPPLRHRATPPGRLDGDWCVVEGWRPSARPRAPRHSSWPDARRCRAPFAVDRGAADAAGRCRASTPRSGLFEVTGECRAGVGGAADGRRLGGRGGGGAACARTRAGRRGSRHARAGPRRTPLERDAVRPSDRRLPGRPPPSGREPCRRRSGRRAARTPPGTTPTPSPPPWPRRSPGRSARTVARHCQQVLAGIGFTDRAPAAPLRPPDDRARPAPRCGSVLTRSLGTDILVERRAARPPSPSERSRRRAAPATRSIMLITLFDNVVSTP